MAFSGRQKAHFASTIRAFRDYEHHALEQINRRRQAFAALPPAHRALMPNQLQLFLALENGVYSNGDVLQAMATEANGFLGEELVVEEPTSNRTSHEHDQLSDGDHGRIRSTLRQIMREWTAEGATERNAVHVPMLQALISWSDAQSRDRSSTRVLVPGCGLGRLAFDVASLGFTAQGNESSLQMLITSNYILNCTERANQHDLYPRIHSLSNHVKREEITKRFSFPDVSPQELAGDLSQSAGDFVEVYTRETEKGQWDAIITCFFLDTAQNVVAYLEAIRNALSDDGVWINCGPLLYHFEDEATVKPAVELPLDDLLDLARRMGFEASEVNFIDCGYNDTSSMLKTVYRAAFWTARKR